MKLSLVRMTCPSENCSGHGECLNGTCFCEIEFEGEECMRSNSWYFVSLSCVYFTLAAICFLQLVLCIIADYKRLKVPRISSALKITNQKVLYIVVFLASLIRGSYFTCIDGGEKESWTRSLMSAYYPFLLSGSSLIVCFWAEIFHLRDTGWQNRQFLSKSSLAFVTFNVICYSLLAAELIIVNLVHLTPELEMFYSHIFNGCYAALLFIVLVFFIIYGIQVFVKVRGGFLCDDLTQSRAMTEEVTQLFPSSPPVHESVAKRVDISQLHQSRLGLLSQALMLAAVIVLLCSETFGHFWKSKVPIHSRNWHNLLFRIIEVGVALWFPCVLWNCMSPEQLWILNPRKLLKSDRTLKAKLTALNETTFNEKPTPSGTSGECWICYDVEKKDLMIQPCLCKGDVRMVHHSCLVKWLVESLGKDKNSTSPQMCCPVCNAQYNISCSDRVSLSKVMRSQAWLQSCVITCFMVSTMGLAILVANLVSNTLAKVLTVGSACLILYVSIRFVCQKQMDAYQRAKVSSMSIENNVSTISEAVLLNKPTSDCDSSTSSL